VVHAKRRLLKRSPKVEHVPCAVTPLPPSPRFREAKAMPSFVVQYAAVHTSRSDKPASRVRGSARRARHSLGVGRKSWEQADPSMPPPPPPPPPPPKPLPYSAVPTPVRTGWEREGSELGWWGGTNRQLHHIDSQQAKIDLLQAELRRERSLRKKAITSRANVVIENAQALERNIHLEAVLAIKDRNARRLAAASFRASADGGQREAPTTAAPAEAASVSSLRVCPPFRSPLIGISGPAVATPRLSSPYGPSGERLCPEPMRRFSKSAWGSSGELGGRESVRAQRDMAVLLQMVRGRKGVGAARSCSV